MKEGNQNMKVTYFSYAHFGSSTGDIYSYSATVNEIDVSIHIVQDNESTTIDVTAPLSFRDSLTELYQKYNLQNWDGFNESDSQVMDGNSFKLEINLDDGTSVKAHGNNLYPQGYNDVKNEIRELFKPYDQE
jgi:hypothetical protein